MIALGMDDQPGRVSASGRAPLMCWVEATTEGHLMTNFDRNGHAHDRDGRYATQSASAPAQRLSE